MHLPFLFGYFIVLIISGHDVDCEMVFFTCRVFFFLDGPTTLNRGKENTKDKMSLFSLCLFLSFRLRYFWLFSCVLFYFFLTSIFFYRDHSPKRRESFAREDALGGRSWRARWGIQFPFTCNNRFDGVAVWRTSCRRSLNEFMARWYQRERAKKRFVSNSVWQIEKRAWQRPVRDPRTLLASYSTRFYTSLYSARQ